MQSGFARPFTTSGKLSNLVNFNGTAESYVAGNNIAGIIEC